MIIKYFKEYGLSMLLRNGIGRVLRKAHVKQKYLCLYDNWKHTYVKKWLYEHYNTVMTYETKGNREENVLLNNHIGESGRTYVWTFWYQGEDEAPDIVKCCINSMKRNTKNKVIILSKYNIDEYCSLPTYIMEKVENKKIGLAHLSDIIRFYLLYYYGGVWLDATCFLTKEFSGEYFSYPFYSLKNFFASSLGWKWTSFFMISERENIISRNMLDFYFKYWKEHDCVITYLVLDCWLEILYEKIPLLKSEIDALPEKEICMELGEHLNIPYNLNEYKEIVEKGLCFHKLTYKETFKNKCNGKQTYYGWLKENYVR